MKRTRLVTPALAITFALLSASCEKNDKPGSTHTSSASETTNNNNATPTEIKTETKTEQPATTQGKAVVTWKNVGLSTPESVLYDEVADVYLVSNIDGEPQDADGKAFIARLSPDGTVATLKWIEGGKNNVTLHSPKGMALMGDVLYVADIDTVRMFDRKTGAPKGEVKVPGATDLNDVTTTADGRVLVSDTGTKRAGKSYEPGGNDALYAIDKDKKVTTVAKSKDLGGPNGLAVAGDKTWVLGGRSGELYSVDAKGKKSDVKKLPKGGADGIVVHDGEILVSSWDEGAIYRGKPDGELSVFIRDVASPADIGLDKKRNRVLVPLFKDNEVRAYELTK